MDETKQPKILAIIPTKDDRVEITVKSLQNQTVGEITVAVVSSSEEMARKLNNQGVRAFHFATNSSDCRGVKIAKSLNFLLRQFDLGTYDYFLRIDADNSLPANFIEANIPLGNEFVHGSASILFLKMKSFLKIMGGKFSARTALEDVDTGVRLEMAGMKLRASRVKVIELREWGNGSGMRYWIEDGEGSYQIGRELLHYCFSRTLEMFSYRQPQRFFAMVGFFKAMLTRKEKAPDISAWVWRSYAHFNFSHAPLIFRTNTRAIFVHD